MTQIRGDAGEPAATAAGAAPPAVGSVTSEMAAELPRKAADAVQLVVDKVHDKAIRPALLAARALVFGLIVLALAAVLVVVGSIALVRLLDVYAFGRQVWLSYVVLGGALTLAGLGAWSRRTARRPVTRAD